MYYLCKIFGFTDMTVKTLSGFFPCGACVSEMQSFSGTDFFMIS